jgi:hypothetical protein
MSFTAEPVDISLTPQRVIVMSTSPPLETLPDALLDSAYDQAHIAQPASDRNVRLYAALVSYILQACPTLAAVLLSAFGTRVHASAVRVLFTSITISDEARCFLAFNASHPVSPHPLSALLSNPDRYGRVVKKITVTDAGLPPPLEAFDAEGSPGLVMVEEEESDPQVTSKRTRVAVQPMPAQNLNELLAVCLNLEEFVWCSSNPPPDGVCQV